MSAIVETILTNAEPRESARKLDMPLELSSTPTEDEKLAAALTDYKPVETANEHITETSLTLRNFHKQLAWQNVISIFILPSLGVLGAVWTPLLWETALLSIIYYFVSGSGIMAGYHRLWSHRSFSATFPLKVYLAAAGAAAVQGSIRWWAFDHRAHHRYTDTDKDPYWVSKGLLYSHMGWMVLKRNSKRIGRTNVSDLQEDVVVRWQHRHYNLIMVLTAFVLPTVVAGLGWHDWRGGFIYAGLLRMFALQQSTFCINSLAHWLGDQPYDDRHSPRNHFFTGIVSLGEGFHNFHHEFPTDYRNSVVWYQYDPMKWCIWVWKQLGLAYDLKEIRPTTVEKGKLLLQQKRLDNAKAKLEWGVPTEKLPVISWDEFQERAEDTSEHALIAIAGIVHDVKPFIDDHPGGRAMICSGISKDATPLFNGGVYDHSNASRNILAEYRVALLDGGGEVEILKRGA